MKDSTRPTEPPATPAPAPDAVIRALLAERPAGRSVMVMAHPDGTAEMVRLSEPPSLGDLQQIVGGYIQRVPVSGHHAYANEEGLIYGLPENPAVSHHLGARLVGTVAILIGVGIDNEGELVLKPDGVDA